MGDIELDDLGDRGEDRPSEDREDQETTFDDDWRDESILDIDPSVREGLERRADRELGVRLGLKKRAYTEDKKNLLRELNINVNKGDGTSARSLFIVQRGKRLVFTEDVKKVSKLNESNGQARKAREEHSTTPVALMEETLDMTVDENLADSS